MSGLDEISRSLQQGQSVTGALRDLSILMEANNSSVFVQTVIQQVPLPLIFGCLTPHKSDQTMLVCGVLDKILSRIPAPDLIKVSTYIELGLQYQDPAVKKTCLIALNKNSNHPDVASIIVSPTMFHLVTQVIGEDNLECAKIASDIILKFLTSPSHLTPAVRQALIMDMSGIMDKNTVVRYRVFELAVRAVVSSEGEGEVFEFISSSGVLTKLLEELDQQDVLAQLSCVELLLSLQESDVGALYLEDNEVLEKLYKLLLAAQQDPFGTAIIPGLLKFFGHMAISKPHPDLSSLLSQYPEFLTVVYQSLPDPTDHTLWGIAIDTFGVLGSTENTRQVLKEHLTKTTQSLKIIGSFLTSGSTEVRTRTLRSLAMIVSCSESSSNWEESTSLQWFQLLAPKPLSLVLSIAKQPFTDLRHGALKVMLSMAPYEWGQREMFAHGGFLEYLLDRHTENDKEGKELKYEIVHTMVESESAERVCGDVDFLKLRKFDQEGPFYYTSDSTVATEGSV